MEKCAIINVWPDKQDHSTEAKYTWQSEFVRPAKSRSAADNYYPYTRVSQLSKSCELFIGRFAVYRSLHLWLFYPQILLKERRRQMRSIAANGVSDLV
jgi:hypothetical protein